MKNKILAIAAVIVAAGCIVSVACSKGETEQNIPASSAENTTKKLSDEELLNMKIIVATSGGELTSGDELELTFDKEKFLTAYEEYLVTTTGENWVAEDILVSMRQTNIETVRPVLKVSSYNVDEEYYVNDFFVLSTDASKAAFREYVFVGANAIGAECIGTGLCAYQGCDLKEIVPGSEYKCTVCLSPEESGTCTKRTFSIPNVAASCRIMHALLY